MAESFDPYLQWLGIRDKQRPPNHYRLLGLELFEEDEKVIGGAADRQMAHVRTFQSGKYSEVSQQILNELAAAKICLLSAQKKAKYDAQLKQQAKPPAAKAPPVAVGAAPPPAQTPSTPGQATAKATPIAVAPVKLDTGSSSSSYVLRDKRKPSSPYLIYGAIGILLVMLAGLIGYLATRTQDVADKNGADDAAPATASNGEEHETGDDGQTDANHDDDDRHEQDATPDDSDDSPDNGDEQPKDPAPWELPAEVRPEVQRRPPEVVLSPAVIEQLSRVRETLAARDVEKANELIAQAESRQETPADREEIDRVRSVATYLRYFWAAVDDAASTLKVGDKFDYRSIPVTVVQTRAGALTLESLGRKKTLSTDAAQIAPDLAVALALYGSQSAGAQAQAYVAAFLAMDREGNPALAREYCEFAALRSVPVDMIVAEVEIDHTGKPKSATNGVPDDPGTSNDPGDDVDDGGDPSEADKRLPVPEAKDLANMLVRVKRIYAEDYAAATKPESMIALAGKLIGQGNTETNDDVSRYVALEEGKALAQRAGDVALAAGAIDSLAKRYQVDPLAEKEAMLKDVVRSSRDSKAVAAALESALALVEQSVEDDRYDVAKRLVPIARSAAIKARDASTRKKIDQREKEIKILAKRFAAAEEAFETLKTNPEDPDANRDAGTYLCLVKGKWDQGLELLTKSSDPAMKAAAEADRASPEKADQQVAVGNGWWELAEKAQKLQRTTGPDAARLYSRTKHWYEKALPKLAGNLLEDEIKGRLEEIAEKEEEGVNQPAVADRKVRDVLGLVVPQRDVMSGSWTPNGTSLEAKSPRDSYPLFVIPVVPRGTEYVVTVEFSRVLLAGATQNKYFFVNLPLPSTACSYVIPFGNTNMKSGITLINNQDTRTNPSAVDGSVTDFNRHAIAIHVQVTQAEVTIESTIDGQPLGRWKGPLRSLSMEKSWALRDPRTLGIGSYSGGVAIHRVQLWMP